MKEFHAPSHSLYPQLLLIPWVLESMRCLGAVPQTVSTRAWTSQSKTFFQLLLLCCVFRWEGRAGKRSSSNLVGEPKRQEGTPFPHANTKRQGGRRGNLVRGPDQVRSLARLSKLEDQDWVWVLLLSPLWHCLLPPPPEAGLHSSACSPQPNRVGSSVDCLVCVVSFLIWKKNKLLF